ESSDGFDDAKEVSDFDASLPRADADRESEFMTAWGRATGIGGENDCRGHAECPCWRGSVQVGKANSREEGWPVRIADLTKESSFGLLRVRAFDPGRPEAALPESGAPG